MWHEFTLTGASPHKWLVMRKACSSHNVRYIAIRRGFIYRPLNPYNCFKMALELFNYFWNGRNRTLEDGIFNCVKHLYSTFLHSSPTYDIYFHGFIYDSVCNELLTAWLRASLQWRHTGIVALQISSTSSVCSTAGLRQHQTKHRQTT